MSESYPYYPPAPAEHADSVLDTFYRLLEPPEWHAQAKCKGQTALFYPSRGDFKETPRMPDHSIEYPARKICRTCPVQAECLEAGANEVHGIWGGATARQRIKTKRDNNTYLRELRARQKAEAEAMAAQWDRPA